MRLSLLLLALSLFVGAHANSDVDAVEQESINADAVWSESQGETQHILMSTYHDQQWSEPVSIYNSENYVSSVTMATLPNGQKIVLWSEDQDRKIVLKYQLQNQTSDSLSWTQPVLIDASCKECLAASPVVDMAGQLWLFWSNNDQGQDEIYFAQYEGGGWTNAQQVNTKNDVPDIQPKAYINQAGQVEVSWSAYSVLSRSYQSAAKTYGEPLDHDFSELLESESLETAVPQPPYLGFRQPFALHFPENRFEQTMFITN